MSGLPAAHLSGLLAGLRASCRASPASELAAADAGTAEDALGKHASLDEIADVESPHDGLQWVLEVPCGSVQQVLELLAAHSWTPQRWHRGNRLGSVVWRSDSKDTRLICLTQNGATALKSNEYGSERCPLVHSLCSCDAHRVRRCMHPQPERPFSSSHALAPLPASASRTLAAALEHVRHLAGVGDEHQFSFCELFAGIGGFRIGLEAIGGRCVLANEWDPACCQAYVHNFGEGARLIAGDVHQIDFTPFKGVDLLVGGFPCQPFSALGPQSGLADPKGQLFRQIERFLREARPRAFLLASLLENVPGLLTSEGGSSLTAVVSALRAVGYAVRWKVVSSAPVTPQRRRRLYFVGICEHAMGPAPVATTDGFEFTEGFEFTDGFEFPRLPELNVVFGDVSESDLEAGSLSPRQFACLRSACSKRGLHAVLLWDDQKAAPIVSHYGHDVSAGASQLRPQTAPRLPRLLTTRECLRIMAFPEAFTLPPADFTLPPADFTLPPADFTRPPADPLRGPRADEGTASSPPPSFVSEAPPSFVSDPPPSFVSEAPPSFVSDPPPSFVSEAARRRAAYRMIGNAVCPPIIAALAGSLLAHLEVPASASGGAEKWREASIRAAVGLMRSALPAQAVACSPVR